VTCLLCEGDDGDGGSEYTASQWRRGRPQTIGNSGISAERCDQLLEEISIWTESEDSVYAAAQCAVIGWKP
jgi:hypothetical protein